MQNDFRSIDNSGFATTIEDTQQLTYKVAVIGEHDHYKVWLNLS